MERCAGAYFTGEVQAERQGGSISQPRLIAALTAGASAAAPAQPFLLPRPPSGGLCIVNMKRKICT